MFSTHHFLLIFFIAEHKKHDSNEVVNTRSLAITASKHFVRLPWLTVCQYPFILAGWREALQE